jgi:hypothetical protein
MRTIVMVVALVGCNKDGSTAPPPAVSSAPTQSVSTIASTSAAPPAASVVGGGSGVGSGDSLSSERTVYGFDKDTAGSAPAGLVSARTGQGREGKWIVKAESDAPSAPNVVAQTDADPTDYRFPVLVATERVLSDVKVSVRCKPVSGKVDQACGIVARYYDADNYYLARANALENNVRLYYVKDGKRVQLASWSGKVTSGEWHTLLMIVHGDHFAVSWDRTKVIDQTDKTFSGAGKGGLWTKADSVTYFDELIVGTLANQ